MEPRLTRAGVPDKRIKPPNEEQLKNLRKGMEVIKQRREERQKKKEERLKKIEAGEISDSEEAEPPPVVHKKVKQIVVEKPRVPRPPIDREAILRSEIQKALAGLTAPAPAPAVVEKIVEKPVITTVERERIVSGSELLNRLFFKS